MCLKSNGTGAQTIYFNSKQQTTCFPHKNNPSRDKFIFSSFSVTLLCTARRILQGFPSAPLLWFSWWLWRIQNGSLWLIPLIIPLMIRYSLRKIKSRAEQDQSNGKIIPVRRYFSQPGTARSSGHWEHIHCRGDASTICPATTLVSSYALSKAYVAGCP